MKTTDATESNDEVTVEKIEFPTFSEDASAFNIEQHLWVNVLLGEEHKVRKCFFLNEDIAGTYTIFKHLAVAMNIENMTREGVLEAFVKKFSALKEPPTIATRNLLMELLETELKDHLIDTSFSIALCNFTIAMIKGKVAEAWEAQEKKKTEAGKVL